MCRSAAGCCDAVGGPHDMLPLCVASPAHQHTQDGAPGQAASCALARLLKHHLKFRDRDCVAWHCCEGGEELQATSTPPPSTAADGRLLSVTAADWHSAAVLYS
ncbi:hypothetical protein E2C01_083023 [Portunus trituberculatus]|uniref:Uncharacterized protein n=1 Tax=Portunus trituberculatus TaxID=210409 RepID=A0A5B7ITU2_PORTR|nr:hypothetical protein [Portunus trituberculatus]